MVSRDWETCKASLSSSHGPESGDEAVKAIFAPISEDGCSHSEDGWLESGEEVGGLESGYEAGEVDLVPPSEDGFQTLRDLQGESLVISIGGEAGKVSFAPINYGGGSSEGVLFLLVLDQGT